MADACASCRFSIEVTAPHLVAQTDRSYVKTKCRRYPVAVEVQPGHWCGEFVAGLSSDVGNPITEPIQSVAGEREKDRAVAKGGRRGR